MKVQLVAAGKYHYIEFANLELLKLLCEQAEIRAADDCDYSNGSIISQTELLISYTCDFIPTAAQTYGLAQWLENGGRWLAPRAMCMELPHLSRAVTPRYIWGQSEHIK